MGDSSLGSIVIYRFNFPSLPAKRGTQRAVWHWIPTTAVFSDSCLAKEGHTFYLLDCIVYIQLEKYKTNKFQSLRKDLLLASPLNHQHW